ncbi:unnamed protein product [Allacma fusca]|uniref:tRNA (guanine(9)-N(1))-methyltransferase n=1 Tax=Allacma fusca TaxID=39272 RepID=A0A8J2KYK6_9HEXA|nr:unnamed protein product [Allacma fusca]
MSEVAEDNVENNSQPETGDPADPEISTDEKPLSKKALKRLAKRAQWDEIKKEKRKQQKLKRKEAGLPNRNKGGGKRRRRFKKMLDSSNKVNIVVDMSFDDLMSEKDLMRTGNQLNRCYSVNRALVNPAQYHITSFCGNSKEATAKQIGFCNWDVHFHEKRYDEVFEKSKIVYLSSESHNVLTEVDEDKVYVIGGLVDHNAKKGLCYQLAEEKGITHARLPLKEWVDMRTRGVLSINQVFSILANVSLGVSWQTAILNAIPARKNAQARQDDDSSNSTDESDDQ